MEHTSEDSPPRRGRTAPTRHRSFRFPVGLIESLERHARESTRSVNALAQRYLEEGVRTDRHPGIVFRTSGAGDRYPTLEGHRIHIHQLVQTVRENANSIKKAAALLRLHDWEVERALRYYAAYKDDVDAYAAHMDEYARRAEEDWLREQEVLGEASAR